ncbi:MAG: Fic family protein [Solirubrobacterales bacterium]
MSATWSAEAHVLSTKAARKPITIRAYLPEPIANRDYLLDAQLASQLSTAEHECAKLESQRDQLGLDGIARQLLRSESVASSRIEGYLISSRRLARAAVSEMRDQNAQTVLGNVAAVAAALDLAARPEAFTLRTFVSIHKLLFAGTADEKLAGRIRTTQNWIGGSASSPAGAEFIPPPAGALEELLVDLAAFCNRTDLPPVLQAAIAHAQFETIHPFMDGNGRAGRALIPMLLRRRGTIAQAIPPISLFLANRSSRYVQGLTNYRLGYADDWFEFFALAATDAAAAASVLAKSIRELQGDWLELAGRPRAGSAARKLIQTLPEHPILSLGSAMEITGASDEACRRALNSLERSGVLNERTAGKRNRIWESVGLFALFDEFERENSDRGRAPAASRQ